MLTLLGRDFGPDSPVDLDAADDPSDRGAEALLATFYHALNHGDADLLGRTWADNDLVQLNNPVGGILRGRTAVVDLYRRIFAGGLGVQVTFGDAVAYRFGETYVVAGRETGSYAGPNGDRVPLSIRTTRVLAHDGGWRMVHHHGSIDDPDELAAYRRAAGVS